MAKTYFATGQIVTPDFLNAINSPVFDGQDIDGHWPPISNKDLDRSEGSLWDLFNSYIDELKVVQGPTNSTLLSVRPGWFISSLGLPQYLPQSSVLVPSLAVSFIWISDLGLLTQGTTLPEDGAYLALARVTTGSGAVGEIEDLRSRARMAVTERRARVEPRADQGAAIRDWLSKSGRAYTIGVKIKLAAKEEPQLYFLWASLVGLLGEPSSEPSDISEVATEIFSSIQSQLTIEELIVFREYTL